MDRPDGSSRSPIRIPKRMVINALNSGAQVYMTDFEDAHSPNWTQTLMGQSNVRDAARRTITDVSPDGRKYALNDETATLTVRPRGLHLLERRIFVDGQPVAGSFFDFGLAMFHNGHALLERGTGPYFYLPKLQNHLEARLWNDVFNFAQDRLGIPRGSGPMCRAGGSRCGQCWESAMNFNRIWIGEKSLN